MAYQRINVFPGCLVHDGIDYAGIIRRDASRLYRWHSANIVHFGRNWVLGLAGIRHTLQWLMLHPAGLGLSEAWEKGECGCFKYWASPRPAVNGWGYLIGRSA